MRYRLRTLLIVLAVGPMVLAGGYWGWQRFTIPEKSEFERLQDLLDTIEDTSPDTKLDIVIDG